MAINLSKGQKISLDKQSGGTLHKVVMGLGWDVKKTGGFFGFGAKEIAIDLDASCVLFDDKGQLVDAVYFRQLKSRDGSIVHTGDNRTGAGDGDDEQIIVDLPNVPAHVKSLILVVNSFTGETFNQIANSFCRIVDASNQKEIARYDLSCNGAHTAMVMTKVYRHDGEWKLHAIGEPARGKTFTELLPAIQPHL